MRVEVIPAGELSTDLAAHWRSLQKSNPTLGSPYFCPEYTQAIAAERSGVEIALIEDGGQFAALFPYQRRKSGRGEPAGGIISDYQALICAPSFSCDPAELIRACRLKAWTFDHLLASQSWFEPFRTKTDLSPIINVSQGFEAYASSCPATRSAQRMSRRLARELGPLSMLVDVKDATLLEQVLTWKSAQYRATGLVDILNIPWIRAAIHRLHATRNEEFSGILSLLYAGDTLVAGHFGMRSATVWHYWFPAYAREHSRHSPGIVLLLEMARAAQASGVSKIDLGKGAALYKSRFSNDAVKLAEGCVDASPAQRLRRQLDQRIRVTAKDLARKVPWPEFVRSQLREIQRRRFRLRQGS